MRVKCANCEMIYDTSPTPADYCTEVERVSTATCPKCGSNAKDRVNGGQNWVNQTS